MHYKTVIFFTYVFANILSATSYQLGSQCSSKYILSDSRLMYDSYADYKTAYHDVSSCASLRSNYNTACCYLKVKFKNSISEEKYTHKGCIEVNSSEWEDIKNVVRAFENNITSSDVNVTLSKKKVSIDCHSNYIKLAGLFIFALLL
jgi:S-adenosylmethionine/arginine decarboxylase-like enzyme